MKAYRTVRKGFTLVEILIVVIILGILAAIVIPQFTNASSDARTSSMQSELQTIRSQLELYKLQHGDAYPTDTGKIDGVWTWSLLTAKTNADGTTSGTPNLGPYLQSAPLNPVLPTPSSTMTSVTTDPAVGTAAAGGWVFSQATGKVFGIDKAGKVTAD